MRKETLSNRPEGIPMNLAELAEHSAEQKGERLALDFEGERLTNVQILEYARRFHRALEELGISRGDVVLTCIQ